MNQTIQINIFSPLFFKLRGDGFQKKKTKNRKHIPLQTVISLVVFILKILSKKRFKAIELHYYYTFIKLYDDEQFYLL